MPLLIDLHVGFKIYKFSFIFFKWEHVDFNQSLTNRGQGIYCKIWNLRFIF